MGTASSLDLDVDFSMRFSDWVYMLDHNQVKDADAGFEAVIRSL
jgi:hypothetical protein